jgi:hypothetical protein
MRKLEANFIYLLIGSDKSLLIDTGVVADADDKVYRVTGLVMVRSVSQSPGSADDHGGLRNPGRA